MSGPSGPSGRRAPAQRLRQATKRAAHCSRKVCYAAASRWNSGTSRVCIAGVLTNIPRDRPRSAAQCEAAPSASGRRGRTVAPAPRRTRRRRWPPPAGRGGPASGPGPPSRWRRRRRGKGPRAPGRWRGGARRPGVQIWSKFRAIVCRSWSISLQIWPNSGKSRSVPSQFVRFRTDGQHRSESIEFSRKLVDSGLMLFDCWRVLCSHPSHLAHMWPIPGRNCRKGSDQHRSKSDQIWPILGKTGDLGRRCPKLIHDPNSAKKRPVPARMVKGYTDARPPSSARPNRDRHSDDTPLRTSGAFSEPPVGSSFSRSWPPTRTQR